MPLPRKPQGANTSQNVPHVAVPHVVSGPEGGYPPLENTNLGGTDPSKGVENGVPIPENVLSTPYRLENRSALTGADSAIGTPQSAQISQSVRPSQSSLNHRWAENSPKNVGGKALMSPMWSLLVATVAPILGRVVPAAVAQGASEAKNLRATQAYEEAIAASTLGQEAPEKPVKEAADQLFALLNGANAALVHAVQLHWGCQRSTTKTGKPPYVDTVHTIVGQVQAGARQSELDADMLAADLVFLDFLDQAAIACLDTQLTSEATLILERHELRTLALDATFQALAAELAQLYTSFAKAEDIQAAGGWPAEKVEIAELKLASMANRMATLYAVLDDHAPHMLPEEIRDTAIELKPNPVMAFMVSCGGYVGLYIRFGQAVAEQLFALAVRWAQPGEGQAAVGAEFKRVMAAAERGQAVAA